MNTSLSLPPALCALPPALLETLGQCHSPATLRQRFGDPAALMAALNHPHPPPVQRVALNEHGLLLELVCCAPAAPNNAAPDLPPDQRLWGLRSFTLIAARWQGAWPVGLDPARVTGAELVRLLAADPAQALVSPSMACLPVPGPDETNWSVLALFDPASAQLQSLALIHLGDWRRPQTGQPTAA